jgi:hypothetical protein
MALVLKDRVKETSTTAGTGTLTLGGAVVGYQTFNAAIASGSTVYYTIQNTAAGYDTEWEVGVGTFTSPNQLARNTVFSSSNSGSLVTFSASPKLQVFITQPAEEAVYLNQATGLVEIGGNGTNTVSFTNINSTNVTATTGSFTNVSGNGVALTAINASNISSGTLSATYGGTGSANLTANNVILGNGASTVKVVAPGTSGNVLTSNGSSWVSQAAGGAGAGTITRTDFTATASQTVFTVSYSVGLIDVYRNGVKLATTDFTATNGTSFTLATGANAGDVIQAEVFSSLNIYSTITADTFSGNAVQTTFTMSVSPYSTASVLVAVSGVVQEPSTYTVSTNTLTFSAAPPTGTNNISVRYLGVAAASAGNASYDTATTSTGYFAISAGTTAQRPGSPTNGMIRYNTSLNQSEAYQNGAWVQYAGAYSIEYLLVAGGAGGGGTFSTGGYVGGGGGGAGGYISQSATVISGVSNAIIIGAGGAGGSASASPTNGSAGVNSTFLTSTATGGGGGGNGGATVNGLSGGSGGGGSGYTSTGGAGTSGQGNTGGNGSGSATFNAGGGGGASAVGSNGSVTGGAGGAGLNWQSLGTFYAGGGGGGSYLSTGGAGGSGGGGTGGNTASLGASGTANTGGGGGGVGGNNPSGTTGAGGSGITIIRYLGSQRGTGGTVTSAGGYTYHTFTASGTFTA